MPPTQAVEESPSVWWVDEFGGANKPRLVLQELSVAVLLREKFSLSPFECSDFTVGIAADAVGIADALMEEVGDLGCSIFVVTVLCVVDIV